MLKLEISQASIKDAPVETKTKLTNDLMRLLQVRDKNADMAKDWLLYLATSKFNKLTAGEIYHAFKLAMSRELLDGKGQEFELLPELSNNTTSKVLTAYIEHKKRNYVYQQAKLKLKEPYSEPTEEEKAESHERYLESLYEDLVDSGFSGYAWLLFEKLESSGKIVVDLETKMKMYREEEEKYFAEAKAEASQNRGNVHLKNTLEFLLDQKKLNKKNRVVQNRCRSILVCNYLKEHLKDYETFKKATE